MGEPRERPILFSGEMVRAILAGRKTQTRRLVGLDTLRPSDTPGYNWTWRGQAPIRSIAQQRRHGGGCWQDVSNDRLMSLCPYGHVGTHLWVRETWGLHIHSDYTCWNCDSIRGRTEDDLRMAYAVAYAADATSPYDHWRPSIHMPRWASRITLEVTDVRVERLQDISEDDARAEGILGPYNVGYQAYRVPGDSKPRYSTAASAFERLWDSINGKRAPWDSNPWVWAVSFRRLT